MSEFIVLGIIPGTQIQITFLLWLLVVVVASVVIGAHIMQRSRMFRNALVTLVLLALVRKSPDSEALWATL